MARCHDKIRDRKSTRLNSSHVPYTTLFRSDRFQQIEPKVMITVDGYEYGGKKFDRMPVVENIQANLPSLEATIAVPYLNKQESFNNLKKVMLWQDATIKS